MTKQESYKTKKEQ